MHEQEIHHAVRRVGPAAHQIEVSIGTAKRREDVHERLDAPARGAGDEHGGVAQVLRVEPTEREGSLAMVPGREPRIRDLAELGHGRVVDRLGQLVDDHAFFRELAVLVPEPLAMASVE